MAEEWLARGDGELRAGLGRFLDVDAGLREVRGQVGGHGGVVRGLGEALDVEGGLMAIWRPGESGEKAGPAWDAAAAVRAVPEGRRLAARRSPAIAACAASGLLVQAVELAGDMARYEQQPSADDRRDRYAERSRHLERDLVRVRTMMSLSYWPVGLQGLGRIEANVTALAAELADVLGISEAWDDALADSHSHALDLATRTAETLSGNAARLLDLPSGDGLAAAFLDGALDDFTHADLTGVDPSDPSLDGIHWSRDTRWLPGTDITELRRRSQETAPNSGIYVLGRPPGRESVSRRSLR